MQDSRLQVQASTRIRSMRSLWNSPPTIRHHYSSTIKQLSSSPNSGPDELVLCMWCGPKSSCGLVSDL